jgi:hypothetical protein
MLESEARAENSWGGVLALLVWYGEGREEYFLHAFVFLLLRFEFLTGGYGGLKF